MLGDSDSESSSSSNASLNALKVNEDYAKAYARRKEREELSKLKDKYGSDADEDAISDESSSETEDEDGEELTPQVDAAILRTLARIRKKDPAIYDSAQHVFQDEQQKTAAARPLKKRKNVKDKPLTIKQHALNAVLAGSRSPSPSLQHQPTHVEEQRALRDETIQAFTAAAEAEDDDFLVPREKTKDEIVREEEEYRAFLEREVGEDLAGLVEIETEEQWRQQQQHAEDEDEKRDTQKKSKTSKGKEKEKARDPDEDQKFLLDYILNRGWIDKAAQRVPTYNEVTSSKRKSKAKAKKDETSSSDDQSSSDSDVQAGSGVEEEEDEVFEAAAAHFEEDYMYRFQEPGAATINAHPRKIPTLVRREDTRRKEARERRKERKEEDLLRKREEVKRLKALKVKELRRKLERIGREGGAALESEALAALDLESEWDPAKHDAQMADIYVGEDADVDPDAGADYEDMEKPQWDDDINIGDIAPEPSNSKGDKRKKKKKRKHGEMDEEDAAVDEAAMDAEDWQGQEDGEEEEWDGTEAMRKRKLAEYMASLDALEFNDVVGGLPTRFKYSQVGADDFGLAPAEILMATDAELNSYVGVKRYAPYRKDRGKKWGPQHGEKLRELREKLKERGVVANANLAVNGEAGAGDAKKRRKGKKERMKEKLAQEQDEAGGDEGQREEDGGPKKKKKKKRHSQSGAVEGEA